MADHPIPVDALDSDIATHNSYTAKGIVERLLDLGGLIVEQDSALTVHPSLLGA